MTCPLTVVILYKSSNDKDDTVPQQILMDDTPDEQTVEISDEEIQELRQAFDLFNKDGDNVISVKEVTTVLVSLGQDPSDKDVKRLVEPFDMDGNGTIDFDEFIGVMKALRQEVTHEDDLTDVFRVLDQDGDGYICLADLRDIVTRLGVELTSEDMQEMISEVDKDGDGQIDYEG